MFQFGALTPITDQERAQEASEAVMAREDREAEMERFVTQEMVAGLSHSQRDAVQSIIGHCFDAKAEFDRTKDSRELSIGCSNATEVVMAQARYIGFVNQAISMVLAECRRLM
jgi:hypothetical protein